MVDDKKGKKSHSKPTKKGTCTQLTTLLIIIVSVGAIRRVAGLRPCASGTIQHAELVCLKRLFTVGWVPERAAVTLVSVAFT